MADDGVPEKYILKKVPTFVKRPESQSVSEGSRFEFVCEVQPQSNVRVTWIKDGKSILPDKYHASSEGNIHRLWCDCAASSDAGRFVCVATNEFGEKRSMAGLVILKNSQQPQAKQTKSEKSLDLSKGSKAYSDWQHIPILSSDSECKSTLKIQLTPVSTSTTTTACDRTLISRVNEADKSTEASCLTAVDSLTCFADSINGKLSINVRNKNISYNSIKFSNWSPSDTSFVRKVNLGPRAIQVQDQSTDNGIGACNVSIEIQEHKQEILEEAADCSFKNCNNKTFEMSDEERNKNISLKVTTGQTPETKLNQQNHFPPEVLHLHPENLQVVRGSDFSLNAKFSTTSDELQVKWYRGTSEIFPDQRTRVEITKSSSTLNICECDPQDSECYTVFIENQFGTDQLSSSVTVEDRPEPPFKQPAVTSITNGSVVLSWYGPVFDGASPLLGYSIEQLQLPDGVENDHDWSTICEDCQHTTYSVTNLKEGTGYKFRIRCRNKHGFSEPGIPSEVITTLKSPLRAELIQKTVGIHPSRNFHDHYRLGEIIGRGRFGVVQECFDEVNDKFAVKIIRLKQDTVTDFKQEVSIMNQLHHAKLLELWDAFESKKEAYLVMEFIGGQELLERITKDDYTLTEGDCIYYVQQICQGIEYMHSKRIMHLDLKLENILCLTEHSNDIKIIDFGLSRMFDPNNDLKVMFGTPEFVAPEVINFDPVSPCSDMWSVGVITYILLSGFSPFSGDSDSETLCNITRAQYDFEEGFDEVSLGAKDFIQTLLLKDPKKRMTSQDCLKHNWLACGEIERADTRLSTVQHKKFLNKRRWQKSGNALRALSRLTGESRFFQRPRGMSVDRKTFLIKLLNRNSPKDFRLLDGIFDSPNSEPRKTEHKRSESLGGIYEKRKSKSFDELLYKDKKSLKHLAVCKALSCISPSR